VIGCEQFNVYGLYQSVSRPVSACGIKFSWNSTVLGRDQWPTARC